MRFPISYRILSILLMFYYSTVYAGQLDTMYINDKGHVVSKENAVLFLAIDKYANDIYEVKDYSMNGMLRSHTFYSSIETWLKHGQHTTYYPNGNKSIEVFYENGSVTGESRLYYENGSLWEIRKYENHSRVEHAIYYPSGQIKRMEYLNDGKATGQCYDENGNSVPFVPYEVMPKYNGDLDDYLSKNIKYPKYCMKKGISGRVLLQFTIDSVGYLRGLKVAKPVHPLLDKEALRVVLRMKDWSPGLRDNKPASFEYLLPVSFKIE